MLPMIFAGTPTADAQEKAAAILKRVELGHRLFNRPQEMSGGQQQRVAIARAFANNPSILLADEPTGNLDSQNGRHVFDLMVQMNRKHNATLMLVTHDHELAASADRRISLRDGRVVNDSDAGKPGAEIEATVEASRS
jgi:putative ABC transport system ATP-binding protein